MMKSNYYYWPFIPTLWQILLFLYLEDRANDDDRPLLVFPIIICYYYSILLDIIVI